MSAPRDARAEMLDIAGEAAAIGVHASNVIRAREEPDHPIHLPGALITRHGRRDVHYAPAADVLAWWPKYRARARSGPKPTAPPRTEWPHAQWAAFRRLASGEPVTDAMRSKLHARGVVTARGAVTSAGRALLKRYAPAEQEEAVRA